MKHLSRQRRFTLLELLAVIVIIAILVSLLFGAFAQVREKAKLVQCVSNNKQIGVAATQYAQANRGQLPRIWNSGTSEWPEVVHSRIKLNGRNYMGAGLLQELGLLDPKVLFCPSAPYYSFDNPRYGWIKAGTGTVITSYTFNSSYGRASSSPGRNLRIPDPPSTPLNADMIHRDDRPYSAINHPNGFVVLRLEGSASLVKSDPEAVHAATANLSGNQGYQWAKFYNSFWNASAFQ
ncbi:MAG: hypothetical protein RL095_690 [Verrucomicrobiota bacterium]|jgi:type II secretory pathway pseudopilin PulG